MPGALPCPNCGCGETCLGCDGTAPSQIQVDISGFTDGACSSCDEGYNGTYVLDASTNDANGCPAQPPNVAVGTCQWTYNLTTTCTHFGNQIDRLSVVIHDDGSGNSQVNVFFWKSGTANCLRVIQWSRRTTTSPSQTGFLDCGSMVNYEVPYFNPIGSIMQDGTVCNHDSSSVFLTAL